MTAGGSRYDLGDLKRCIAVSFSAGELSRFAERFGIMLDREGSTAESARMLVRAMAARGELDRLVDNLHQVKPLVEWPEPAGGDYVPDYVPTPPSMGRSGEPAPPFSSGPGLTLDSPGSLGPPLPPPPPRRAPAVADPYASEPEPKREAPPWRWIAIGAGGMLVLALGAVGVWLLVRDEAPAIEGIAALAADHMRGTVDAVARTCDAQEADSARERLADAFRRCTSPPRIRPGVAPALPAPPPPPAAPIPAAPRPAGAPKTESSCLDRCQQFQSQCQESECGAEPRSAEKYAAYQKCLGECMTKFTRCRMACR